MPPSPCPTSCSSCCRSNWIAGERKNFFLRKKPNIVLGLPPAPFIFKKSEVFPLRCRGTWHKTIDSTFYHGRTREASASRWPKGNSSHCASNSSRRLKPALHILCSATPDSSHRPYRMEYPETVPSNLPIFFGSSGLTKLHSISLPSSTRVWSLKL